MLVDYHLHSHVSHDGSGSIEEYARRAAELGLSEICLTEHLDFYPSWDGSICQTVPSLPELELYAKELREAASRTPLKLRLGVELDYKPEADRWVRDLLARLDLDFVLGSVHNVSGWGISGPRDLARAFFDVRGVERGCLEYLELVQRAVSTGLFDAFAHLDLVKRFIPGNGRLILDGHLRDRVVEILDTMAATGTAIEINGSGWDHDPQEAYPSLDLLRLARERGVEGVTVGSDSHRPATVGRHLFRSLELARAAGYERLYTFEKRIRQVVPLQSVGG